MNPIPNGVDPVVCDFFEAMKATATGTDKSDAAVCKLLTYKVLLHS
jgi:hypothetical protein